MFEQTFKNIDIHWKEAGCSTKLDYTEIVQLRTRPTGPVAKQPKQPTLL